MSVMTDRLAKPNSRKIVLLEITAGNWIYFWQLATGQTYTWEHPFAGSSVGSLYGVIEDPGEVGGMFEPGFPGIPELEYERFHSPYRIVDLKENGVSLTSRASVALVESNAGSFFWDQNFGKLYVHPTGSVSPYTKTFQAMIAFCFATEGRIYNGISYEPRIASLPQLSIRVEKTFGDPGQIGAGSLTLLNGDGFFDAYSGFQWDAGRAVLKIWVDGINYADVGP